MMQKTQKTPRPPRDPGAPNPEDPEDPGDQDDPGDAGDPVDCAQRYEAEGADELVILDVSATLEGRQSALETVRQVRSVLGIPLTVGGGIRALDDALALLEAGADTVHVR